MSQRILIPLDEGQPLALHEYDSLQDYQQAVGGYVEAIPTGWLGMELFAHDEAKVIGLGINRRATLFWWLSTPAARQRDLLAGDVVLVGSADSAGDPCDVPSTAKMLLFASSVAVEVAVEGTSKWHRVDEDFESFFDAALWGLDLFNRRREVSDVRVTSR